MGAIDLQKLNNAVEFLINQKSFSETVLQLEAEIHNSPERFVWSVIDLDTVEPDLPPNIKSGWIFVLKADVPSGCHYHPNSVQHMTVIKGQGMSKVGARYELMTKFGSTTGSLE